MSLVSVGFGEVDCAGKQDDADEEEEDQEAELSHTGLKGLTQYLKTFGVSGKFEYPEDPNESDDPEDSQRHGLIIALALVSYDRPQRDEVWNDGHDVDTVHDVLEEAQLLWAGSEPNQKFKGEPYNTTRFNDEEWLVELWNIILLNGLLGIVDRSVDDPVVLKLWQGL